MSKIDVLIKEINKEYKEDIAFKGNDIEVYKYEKVPFSSPRLNYMLYGGLPMGRMIEFAGPEKSGKTTTALDMVKQCQLKFKKEKQGRKVCFVDSENTFDVEWATKLGVNVDDLILIRPQEQYAEQIFDIMKAVVETGEVGLIVLDSVAQLVGKNAISEDIEKKQYGGIAMPLTKFCNIVVPLLGKYNCMCIMINQVREDLNNQYNEFITPGGRGFKHNCSVRLMFRQGSFIDVNNRELTRGAENPAGNLVKVHIEKSKICRSDRRTGFYTLNYLNGIDYLSDTIDVLLQLGAINQRGAYFDLLNIETGEILYDGKIQGKPALLKLLRENPELFKKLQDQISYN
nr:UvsX-like recombinase [Caudoviricetes sp.]